MKFKSIISIITVLITAFSLCLFTGCQDEEAEQPEEMIDYEIALITDDGLINDHGTSEAVWNTLTDFGSSKGISHKYYKATQAKANAVREVLDTAVDKGAKIVVVDNSSIANVVFKLQKKYEDIDFVTINTDPYEPEFGDILIKENTAAITFATEQAGYLAGYAAVSEGYTQLGCLVENSDQQMKNYLYGFAKGANRAAMERGETVKLRRYVCDLKGTVRKTAAEKADKWYREGTEVIFVCGDKIEDVVIEEAESHDGKVIAGITDKGEVSDTVIISAVVNIDLALKETLDAYLDQKFPGGEVLEYGIAEDAVGLDYQNSRLKHFDKAQYDALYEQIKSGDIRIKVKDIENVQDLELENIEL
ncbi:MAG: BMP family ABC transporter substrate-binding protein [Firmicutes bacterium]|nr:BMP family ABC transporter substrate-binding protein [Bacillota bacterium]